MTLLMVSAGRDGGGAFIDMDPPGSLAQVALWQREGHSTLPLRVRFPAPAPGACTGGAGLWRSSFDAHGRDHSCERPPCGDMHLNLATLGQAPNVATSNALVSEESGLARR